MQISDTVGEDHEADRHLGTGQHFSSVDFDQLQR